MERWKARSALAHERRRPADLGPRSRLQPTGLTDDRQWSYRSRRYPEKIIALISDKGKRRGKVKSRVPLGRGQLSTHSPRYSENVTL